MPAAPERKLSHNGRIMKCVTFLLLLPETLKRLKRASKHPGRLSLCYNILTLSLKKRMAAELYPVNDHAPVQKNETVMRSLSEKKRSVEPVAQTTASIATTPTTEQNINNNNVEIPSWHSAHPTLRERQDMLNRSAFVKYKIAVLFSSYGALKIYPNPSISLFFIRYMYSDEIELAADTVLATLYAAKKYLVSALARACVGFLETSLEARNACVLLSQSRLFEEPELTQRCWEVIDAQAELALRSEGFTEIDLPTLEHILQRETLNVKEAVVFQAIIGWADAECRRQGLTPLSQNQRSVLGKALHLVRLPSMMLQEFADGAAQSNILTLEETHNIFLWYTAATKPVLGFPVEPRKGLMPQRCHRFQSSAYRSNQWRYLGRCDSIQFAVDKRVFIAGLGLYGSSGGKAEYSVRIELKRQGVLLAQNLTKFVSDGSSSTFPVWFEHPVQVEQDAFYTVSAVLDGNELSYFGQEGMTEVQCGKVTFQFQCSSDSTNGTGVQGGQIPELIFYA
uniref:BTB (POZ) domain containing 6a n=1 Tax=Cyprinus carpio TaxID=7962 RepID=A0A8C2JVZ1_CYPCA